MQLNCNSKDVFSRQHNVTVTIMYSYLASCKYVDTERINNRQSQTLNLFSDNISDLMVQNLLEVTLTLTLTPTSKIVVYLHLTNFPSSQPKCFCCLNLTTDRTVDVNSGVWSPNHQPDE